MFFSFATLSFLQNPAPRSLRLVDMRVVQRLTQGVERGDVLQHVVGLLGTRLPHQAVHVVSEADARHLRRAHRDGEEVLVGGQIHLRGDEPDA